MQSLWHATVAPTAFPPLSGDLYTPVAIIGGGLVGILCAYMLKEQNIPAVVLEADRIGSGQSGNSTAKITAQHGLIYYKLIQTLGRKMAGLYAEAAQRSIRAYKKLIAEKGISCGYEERSSYLYTVSNLQALEMELKAARSLGLSAWLTHTEELPFPVRGCLRFDHQAQFHPLLFLQALARELTIYEHTQVLNVHGHTIQTDRGTVTAERILFTCHYPFVNQPGYYFLRMHQERGYCLALKNTPSLSGMYLGIDPSRNWSMRSAGNILILEGGGHRTGSNTGGRYEMLRKAAARWWPESRLVCRWSAQDCVTPDSVPYIGPYSSAEPDWYIASGFDKWGITHSMTAALLLRDLICGTPTPYAELFSPSRHTLLASAGNLIHDAQHNAKALLRRFLPASAGYSSLEPGHGGIVSIHGEKIGIYREKNGTPHCVEPFCPHMGCQLEWNPDELSWDCPCHGSRFDYDGQLLDDPAQADLLRPSCIR